MTQTEVGATGWWRKFARRRTQRRTRRSRVALLGCLALVFAGVTWMSLSRSSRATVAKGPSVEDQVASAVDRALRKAASAPSSASTVYQTISPSLVVITTDEGSTSADVPTETIPGQKTGLGTGVIINDQGAILTANHVIQGAIAIRVNFADGTTANASVVSQDPTKDIAVLEADATPTVLVPATLGGGVKVGDAVFAVGHPLGLLNSLSAGVVSGLGRSIPIDDNTKLDDLIQFDAAVNPGNSGGPLLNRNGQVIGIVTALANPSEQNFFVGIGFAVPIETAGGVAGGPSQ